MSTPRAADLLVSSVVVADYIHWTKEQPADSHPWRDSYDGRAGNAFIDVLLAEGRAEVLRVGTGQAQQRGEQ